MNQIINHILLYLKEFTKNESVSFFENFRKLQSKLKEHFIYLLKYVDYLLEKELSNKDELSVLHLHFNDEFSEIEKLLIAEFLLIKVFKSYELENNLNDDSNLQYLITELNTRKKKLESNCPEGAKIDKKKGPNKIWNEWIQDKRNINTLIQFYNDFNKDSIIRYRSIFNSQSDFSKKLNTLFDLRPFATNLDSKYPSYTLINTTHTLNDLDLIDNELIDKLDSIALFDCERKRIMTNFSFEEINKWNSDFDTRFTKYFIITFGKENSAINHTRNKLELIRERFKIPINSSYTITKSELDFLLNREESTPLNIEFVGFESSSFWETFVLETSIRELYELRSIKLMNIYSVCYNDEIKNYIISDLFSKKESSELVSSNTKMVILELRDDDIEILKEGLSNTLDVIINSGIKSKVLNELSNTQAFVLDEAILRNLNLYAFI
jgi:hypothetical protein